MMAHFGLNNDFSGQGHLMAQATNAMKAMKATNTKPRTIAKAAVSMKLTLVDTDSGVNYFLDLLSTMKWWMRKANRTPSPAVRGQN